jgi:hypothetical protein
MQQTTHKLHRLTEKTSVAAVVLGLTLGIPFTPGAHAQELLTNGGFETGNLNGWKVVDAPGSTTPGSFLIGNNTPDANFNPATPSTPLEHFPSVGAKSGNYYAVSDSAGPGAHALLQNFTLAPNPRSVIFSFDMFVNDWNGAGVLNADLVLDPNQQDGMGNLIPTQFVSVDLLAGNAADLTDDVGLINNFYLGEDGYSATALPNGYEHFQYDITGLVANGGMYRVRFAEVDNQFTINAGIDNMSVYAVPANVPEPGNMAMGLALFGGCLTLTRNRRRNLENRLVTQAAGE